MCLKKTAEIRKDQPGIRALFESRIVPWTKPARESKIADSTPGSTGDQRKFLGIFFRISQKLLWNLL